MNEKGFKDLLFAKNCTSILMFYRKTWPNGRNIITIGVNIRGKSAAAASPWIRLTPEKSFEKKNW